MSERAPTHEGLSGNEIIAHIRSRVEQWDFTTQDKLNHNALFAHKVINTLWHSFVENEKGLLVTDRDKNLRGESIPEPLNELILHNFGDELNYVDENRITIRRRNEHIQSRFHIEGFESEDLDTFAELVERGKEIVRQDPTKLIRLPEQRDETFIVEYEPMFVFGWGISFMVGPGQINPSVFGKSGQTGEATAFAARYYNDQNMLAHTVAHLSVLAAEHSGKELQKPLIAVTANDIDEMLSKGFFG